MTRTELIADLADDIACGHRAGRYDAAFFLDAIIDLGRVDRDDVASLILSTDSDVRANAVERIRELVKESAIEFFTTGNGTDYIDGVMDEKRAEAEADAEYLAKYGESR